MNKENLGNINGSLEDHNWDKGSTNSDVSANTDMKVFHGAICSKDDMIGKLNKKKELNTKPCEIINDKLSFSKIKIKKDKDRVHIVDIKSIEKNEQKLQKNRENTPSITKSISPSENIATSEMLSFRNELDINSNISRKITEENKNSQKLLIKFKELTEEDEELISNGFIPKTEPSSIYKKRMVKTMTNSKLCFKVAMIEKGVALLVSNEDCIFTLPTFLLPKEIKVGNTYSFNIEETNNNTMIKNKIILMQKKYIPNINIVNNVNSS